MSGSCSAGATLFRAFLIIGSLLAFSPAAAPANYERGAMIRVAQICVSPDASSAKLAWKWIAGAKSSSLETSREWAHVQANLTEERTITGGPDKGVVRCLLLRTETRYSVWRGASILEDQASRRHGTQRRCPGRNAALLPRS
jgi:hypothetical protein